MKRLPTVQILVFTMLLLMTSLVMAEKLSNLSSGYCLDTDGNVTNGGAVRMWSCATHPNQTWTVEQVESEFYRLINHSSKFCLDTDGLTTNGAQVRMWECVNHPNQLWEIRKMKNQKNLPKNRYRLVNKASGLCLDTDGGAVNGGAVRMWSCSTHPNQSWLLPPIQDVQVKCCGGSPISKVCVNATLTNFSSLAVVYSTKYIGLKAGGCAKYDDNYCTQHPPSEPGMICNPPCLIYTASGFVTTPGPSVNVPAQSSAPIMISAPSHEYLEGSVLEVQSADGAQSRASVPPNGPCLY